MHCINIDSGKERGEIRSQSLPNRCCLQDGMGTLSKKRWEFESVQVYFVIGSQKDNKEGILEDWEHEMRVL